MSKASKTLKRIAALVATFAMALALVPAFALAEDKGGTTTPTHTITITEPTGNVDSHSYEAYQVFAGTYNTTSQKLEGITWGAGVNGPALLQALKDDATIGGKFANATDAVTAAAAMKDMTAAETDAMAKVIAGNLKTAAATGQSPLTVTGDGYYFVKDVSTALTNDTYSKYILQVCNNVEITAQDGTTTSQKKVKDTNDSATENATSGWQDSADYDIGDMVPFQLTGTVASDYANFDTYYFAFHDKYNKQQLGAPQNIVVKLGNTTIDSSKYEVKTTEAGFDVIFTDLKTAVPAATAGSAITVEYESKLLEGANIGAKGNLNSSNIEFSNDSNNEDEGHHGTTPDDTVIVFTYKTTVNKVDESGNALAGAGFTLYKKYADTTKVPAGKTADADGWVAVNTFTGGTDTTFTFTGIDDGTYKLVESKVPEGYTAMEDITFTVSADHTVTFESGQPGTDGKLGNAYVLNGLTAQVTNDSANKTATFNNSTTDGAVDGVTTTVENKSGSTLPSTGGIGVLPFILVGCGIAAAAGIGLHTSRAKREEA